jgi:hypothetical protein
MPHHTVHSCTHQCTHLTCTSHIHILHAPGLTAEASLSVNTAMDMFIQMGITFFMSSTVMYVGLLPMGAMLSSSLRVSWPVNFWVTAAFSGVPGSM